MESVAEREALKETKPVKAESAANSVVADGVLFVGIFIFSFVTVVAIAMVTPFIFVISAVMSVTKSQRKTSHWRPVAA